MMRFPNPNPQGIPPHLQRRYRLVVLALVIVVLIGIGAVLRLSRGKQTSAKPFRVGIATWPGFAPGYISKEKGFFGPFQVSFSILDDFTARQNAFISGSTDATIGTLDSFAFDTGKGVKAKAVLILDESSGADAIVARPAIASALDLKGKKIAYTRGSPSHFFLIKYLKRNGLSMNDIARVEVDDPGRAGDAFVAGAVDAAVTWEPNITQIISSSRGHILENTRTFPGQIVDLLEVSPEVYTHRKADIQAFVNGWLQAIEYIESNQAEAFAIMSRNLAIDPKNFPNMAAGLKFADLSRNRALLIPTESSQASHIFDEASTIWAEEGLIASAQPAGRDLITPEFIRQSR